MKKMIFAMAVVLILGLSICHGYVLTFDDIGIATDESKPVPDGYGGLNWGDHSNGGSFFYFDPRILTPNSGFNNGLVSENYLVTCGEYGTPGIGRIIGSPFTFNGAYFSAGSRDGLNIQVDGYLEDGLIYTTTVVVDTTDAAWFNFNYIDIDELRFAASGGTHHEGYEEYYEYFSIDNFTYVPEPATLLLFTLGAFGVRGLNV